jgi:hypothetical protein
MGKNRRILGKLSSEPSELSSILFTQESMGLKTFFRDSREPDRLKLQGICLSPAQKSE